MQTNNKKWEHFSHSADVGIRGYGTTLTEAFEAGAMALSAVVTDLNKINPLIQVPIHCTAPDYELLFIDWLNAIIYEMDTRNMLFSEFNVTIDELHLKAEISGETINREKHQPAVDVKGATYTALKVTQQKGIWIAQCVVDV